MFFIIFRGVVCVTTHDQGVSMAKGVLTTSTENPFSIKSIFLKFMKSEKPDGKGLYQTIHFKKGESHTFKHMNTKGLYFVVSGILKLEMVTPIPRLVRLVTRGDMVGYGSWNVAHTNSYQVTAIEESEAQFWPSNAIDDLESSNPEFKQLIIDHLISIIQHKDERITSLESHSNEERVLRLLLWLCKKFGRRFESEILIDINLDRNSFAQLSGTIPETFSRVITILQDKKLVRRRRRQLIIKDALTLQKYIEKITK